jgi:hypothetical protein
VSNACSFCHTLSVYVPSNNSSWGWYLRASHTVCSIKGTLLLERAAPLPQFITIPTPITLPENSPIAHPIETGCSVYNHKDMTCRVL